MPTTISFRPCPNPGPLSALLGALLLAGCASRLDDGGPMRDLGDRGVAIVATSGIDDATRRSQPIAWLAAVNDQQVGSRTSGFPDRTRLSPGSTRLTIYCAMPPAPGQVLPAGAQPPSATIALSYEFRAGATYWLNCERTSPTSARAWVQQEGMAPAASAPSVPPGTAPAVRR